MTKKTKQKKNYSYSLGRRRTASARVRLFKGDNENLVNGQVIGKYFPGEAMKRIWSMPFDLTNTVGKYFVTVKVAGGGIRGQLVAVVTGIAKALSVENPAKFRKLLKKAGLLTRDSRIRERRKVGTGGKARRKRQSPKR